MRYLSVCSGIEAASVAWHHLGWEPIGFSEIEPFPAAVLAHRFPSVPNFGDMTKYEQWPLQPGSIDVLVGGTPCQSFSVAGLRKGLEDPRGNLMLTYLAIAARLQPRWVVWENVPGVLSSNGGRDFATFLSALGQLGYGWAYRVLDAQYVRVGRWPRAVPQRRRRVFVVGRLLERGAGDWTAAAEVLALREGLQRHFEASGKTRKGAASDAEVGARGGCWWDGGQVSETLHQSKCGGAGVSLMPDKGNFEAVLQPTAYRWQNDALGLQQDDAVAALRASAGSSGFHEMNHPVIAQPAVAFPINTMTMGDRPDPSNDSRMTMGVGADGDPQFTLSKAHNHAVAHAFYSTGGTHGVNQHPEVSPAVKVGSGLGIPSPPAVAQAMTVRRLTPVECERLQGFPDNWTAIPWRKKPAEECPDGPRYKALGNSMACNCMAWIGERIAKWEAEHA